MSIDVTEFFKDFLAGGLAATVGRTLVAPIDRIKLILQVQDISRTIKSDKRYKGMGDALIRLTKEEGFFSLWRGNLAGVGKYFPLQSLGFSFNKLFGRFFTKGVDKENHYYKFVARSLISGGIAGVTAEGVVYPLDFARTRLAADMGVSNREFKGMWDVLKKTAQTSGIVGWYKGFSASAQGYFIYRAIYFGIYDVAKDKYLIHQQNFLFTFTVAQLTTMAAGLFSYPFDTVRRRLMMQSGLTKEDQMYRSTFHCWVHTYQTGGIIAFFRGSVANMVRGVGGAITLILFDEIKAFLG